MIKDFSISFSRVIIVQDFETVTFYVICIHANLQKGAHFKSVQIVYISTSKHFSFVRGYIEVKINEHKIW